MSRWWVERPTSGASEPLRVQEYLLTVNLTLYDQLGAGQYEVNSDCDTSPSGYYRDLRPGAPVTVFGRDGDILGANFLGQADVSKWPASCMWSSEIVVPAGEGNYTVEVASFGKLTYPEDDIVTTPVRATSEGAAEVFIGLG